MKKPPLAPFLLSMAVAGCAEDDSTSALPDKAEPTDTIWVSSSAELEETITELEAQGGKLAGDYIHGLTAP